MHELAEQAAAVLAGGCDSPVRSGWAVGGEPFLQSRGEGAYAYDERGERYIDYVMAYGPLLFGHTHPALTSDLDELGRAGVVYGNTHQREIELAERIRAYLPSMQRMRFTTTGTEAAMSAIRVARAFTGRSLILKFAGNYHGHFDLALLNAGASAHTANGARSGIPAGIMHDLVVARYNDLENVDALLAGRERELAAIIVEPIVGNMGYVTPVPGFLRGLRERADRYGALLIFDEVITWLRFGLRGTQGLVTQGSSTQDPESGTDPSVMVRYRTMAEQAHAERARVEAPIIPDMTLIGKIMGGGFPIAAFGGREDVMAVLAPTGATFTGGTHAGNPFSVGMAHRVLDLLEAHPEYYPYMRGLATRLADGIREIFAQRKLPYAVVQHESIVDFKFRPGPPNRNYDDALAAEKSRYAAYYHAMRARKILLPPSQNEVMFVSTAHTQRDIDETLTAIAESFYHLCHGEVSNHG